MILKRALLRHLPVGILNTVSHQDLLDQKGRSELKETLQT